MVYGFMDVPRKRAESKTTKGAKGCTSTKPATTLNL